MGYDYENDGEPVCRSVRLGVSYEYSKHDRLREAAGEHRESASFVRWRENGKGLLTDYRQPSGNVILEYFGVDEAALKDDRRRMLDRRRVCYVWTLWRGYSRRAAERDLSRCSTARGEEAGDARGAFVSREGRRAPAAGPRARVSGDEHARTGGIGASRGRGARRAAPR